MIMKEDKIIEAANKYALDRIDKSYKSYSEHRQLSASTFSGEDVSEAFLEGAKYALSNQWHDVKDELPTFEEDVIVSDGDDYWFGHRTDDKSVIIDNNSFAKVGKLEVKYWMPIPILSTCTKNEKI